MVVGMIILAAFVAGIIITATHHKDDEEMEDTIRKFQCECFCTFYLPDGIEPAFCPHCGGACAEVKIMKFPDDEGLGQYLENDSDR